jgi:hypothetical protein
VEYEFGVAPPLLGEKAAAELACQLYRACPGASGECILPTGVTRVSRLGVEVAREPFISWGRNRDGQWGTGLTQVDMFLSTYNPAGLRRPSVVWSPDLVPYGKPIGQGGWS